MRARVPAQTMPGPGSPTPPTRGRGKPPSRGRGNRTRLTPNSRTSRPVTPRPLRIHPLPATRHPARECPRRAVRPTCSIPPEPPARAVRTTCAMGELYLRSRQQQTLFFQIGSAIALYRVSIAAVCIPAGELRRRTRHHADTTAERAQDSAPQPMKHPHPRAVRCLGSKRHDTITPASRNFGYRKLLTSACGPDVYVRVQSPRDAAAVSAMALRGFPGSPPARRRPTRNRRLATRA